MFSVALSAMFAALTYKGNFFNSPEYFVAAIAGAVTTSVFMGELFADGSWMFSAAAGYIAGLVGCVVYDRIARFANRIKETP